MDRNSAAGPSFREWKTSTLFVRGIVVEKLRDMARGRICNALGRKGRLARSWDSH